MADNKVLEYAAVFAEGLTPQQRERLGNADELGMDMAGLWDLVLESHVLVIEPTYFVRIADKKLINGDSFTAMFSPLVNALPDLPARYRDNPVKLAKSTMQMRRASAATYQPGGADWIGTQFNMWRGPGIKPLAERPAIILDHIMYVIPNRRECGLFADYLAWMVQRPNDKMSFALLIVGPYGVGKSWFSKLLTALFGEQNVLVIEKGVNIADKFNAEQANKQVIFVDEIVPDGKLSVARAMEPKIVGTKIAIELKGKDKVWLPNRFNVVGVSNYENAIKINGPKDRKWLIVRATDDLRYSDDKNKPTAQTHEYYTRLHAVTPPDGTVTDEVRRMLWWLQKRDISKFNGQGIAPETTAKKDVAEATASTIESDVSRLYSERAEAFAFELFTVHDVRESLPMIITEGPTRSMKELDAEVAAAMVAVGCRRVSDKQVTLNAKLVRVWCAHKGLLAKYKGLSTADLASAYLAQRKGSTTGAAKQGDDRQTMQ